MDARLSKPIFVFLWRRNSLHQERVVMFMKIRVLTFLLLFVFCITLFAGCSKQNTGSQPPDSSPSAPPTAAATKTVVANNPSVMTADGVSQSDPDSNVEMIERLVIQKDVDGEDISVLLRTDLPAAIQAAQVESAFLRLKRTEGTNPSLTASGVIPLWSSIEVTWNRINETPPADTTVVGEQDGDWYQIDVTEIVRSWFGGKYANYGFLLTETEAGSKTVFFSPYDCDEDDAPVLEVNYTPTEVSINEYPYIAHEDGNCLSFALRDTGLILENDLGLMSKKLEEQYRTAGLDGVQQYIQTLCENYVMKNKNTLEIESFREISGFDAPINDGEYRIAFRVGVTENADGTLTYDYHFQIQLPDGSWAEKLGQNDSRIVPGSNLDLDPGLFPWDQNAIWGIDKYNGFYGSKTTYYAVKKDSTKFTNHMASTEY